MSFVVSNQVSFLRTTRNFPFDDVKPLAVECDRTYIDIANAVNSRIIGIFPLNTPILTGESWFIDRNKRQQSFRRVYTFTSSGNIAHGINTTNIYGFTRIYGTFTDNTNFYPLPYVDVVNASNQISVIVTPTNIVITRGAGAPAIVSGIVVLEWLSQA